MRYLKRLVRNKSLVRPKTYGFDAVDEVRNQLLKTDYERFPESKLDKVKRAMLTAQVSNEIEGSYRTPEEVALDEMFIDMRIPIGAVRRYAVQLWLDLALQPGSDLHRRAEFMRQFQDEIKIRPSFSPD